MTTAKKPSIQELLKEEMKQVILSLEFDRDVQEKMDGTEKSVKDLNLLIAKFETYLKDGEN